MKPFFPPFLPFILRHLQQPYPSPCALSSTASKELSTHNKTMQRLRVVHTSARHTIPWTRLSSSCWYPSHNFSTAAATTTTTPATESTPGSGDADDKAAIRARRAEEKRLAHERKWTETDFIKRRKEYREKLRGARVEFRSLQQRKRQVEEERRAAGGTEVRDIRMARARRRRERSLVRVAEHRARVEAAKMAAQERAAHGVGMWQSEQARVMQEKIKRIQLLEQEAPKWITEDNLKHAVDQVVDDFMIASTRRTDLDSSLPSSSSSSSQS